MTAGIVLAGGRSTRMGTAKADLDWHGQPLVAHVAATLREALDRAPVLVVAAPGQRLPPLPPHLHHVRDPAEGRGPLQGLIAGLSAAGDLGAEAAVVVATDQPFAALIVPRLLAALTDADDAVAVEGQPLGALYRVGVRATAEQRLAARQGSLRGLLDAVRTRVLAADADALAALTSLDTPEAYAEALRTGRPD